MRLASHQGCGNPPAPSLPPTWTSDHAMRNIIPPSAHMLKAEACFRICTDNVFVWLPLFVEQPQKVLAQLQTTWLRKVRIFMLCISGILDSYPIPLLSLSSNRENIHLCLFPLFMGNLSYLREFLNIHNLFIKDLLGGVCLLWEVKERPRK